MRFKIILFLIFQTLFLFLFLPKSFAEEKSIRVNVSEDTTVHSSFPSTSYSGRHYLALGYESGNGYLKSRIYTKYDLSPLVATNILPEQITSATIKFKQFKYLGRLQEYDVQILEPTSQWLQKSTSWDNQPSIKNFGEVVKQSKLNDWKSFNITDLVKRQLGDNDWSKGVGFRFPDEDLRGVHYWSIECIKITDLPTCALNEIPYLEIIYNDVVITAPELMEPQAEYLTKNAEIVFKWDGQTEESEDITKDKNLTFELESQNAQSEEIKYRFKIKLEDEIFFFEENLSEEQFQYTFNLEGSFTWLVCTYEDNNSAYEICSEERVITIDWTAPNPPTIDYIPTPHYGREILLTYTASENEESTRESVNFINNQLDHYEIEYSRGETFEEKLTLNSSETHILIEDLEEGDAFFRVRAIDSAGNISDWSDVRSTEVLHTQSMTGSIQTSELHISPKGSKGIKDFTNIEIKINTEATDITEGSWEVRVTNSNGSIASIIPIPNLAEQTVTFPLGDTQEANQLMDGNYTLLLTYISEDGEVQIVDYTNLIVDNLLPKGLKLSVSDPTLINRNDKFLSNKRNLDFTVESEEVTLKSEVYLNDKKIYEGEDYNLSSIRTGLFDERVILNEEIFKSLSSNSFRIDFNYEGENKLLVKLTDRAGNSSQTELILETDWTPPPTPTLTLKYDTNRKSINGIISAEPGSRNIIYNSAGIHNQLLPGIDNVLLVEKWVPQISYLFSVQSVDQAGNISNLSPIVSYKTPAEPSAIVNNESTHLEKSIPKVGTIIRNSICSLTFNIESKVVSNKECDLNAPIISTNTHLHPEGDIYWINLFGKYNRKVKVLITYVKCKPFSILDPATWRRCIEVKEGEEVKDVDSYGLYIAEIDKKRFLEYQRNEDNEGNYQLLTASTSDYSLKEIQNLKEVLFNIQVDGKWVDFKTVSKYSNKVTIEKAKVVKAVANGDKYFRFPFNKIIGVTQWHGTTAFSPHHTGIDFNAVREPIYAMADGYIKVAGWDSYYGECLSGGNFVRIEHDNGMSSVYLHLEDFNKESGEQWKVGERIKKGDLLGRSGNTGAYNCQPLGHHLHLEIRKEAAQSTNVDPVQWIDIDWDKVLTIGAAQYPGRLSGNNPHPGK